MSENNLTGNKHKKNYGLFFILLLCGLAVFLIGMTFSPVFTVHVGLISKISVVVVFSIITLFLHRNKHLNKYWTIFFSFFVAASAVLAVSLLGQTTIQLFQLNLKTPHGIAFGKLIECVIIIIPIILFIKVSRQDFASIYLQKGNFKKGIIIGFSTFVGFSILAVLRMMGQNILLENVFPLIPWILIFVLANGTMEELLFRGIFLKKCESFLGANLSNILTALIFAIAHMQVTYTANVPIFVLMVFFLGLGLGHAMQKTDSLIAPALFHAGADTCFMIDVFTNLGANI
jgi:membrane protease YdiL (CAAX protease family)